MTNSVNTSYHTTTTRLLGIWQPKKS